MKPATNWFDESFAPSLKSHERFARQQRSRSSITYHVTSTNSRIDHQLSGIKNIVLMHGIVKKFNREKIYKIHLIHFHCETWIDPRNLTIFSNSLIRVSRRDGQSNSLSDPKIRTMRKSFASHEPVSGKAQGSPQGLRRTQASVHQDSRLADNKVA